jgi:dTDP-glucose 4,6-dehydratase
MEETLPEVMTRAKPPISTEDLEHICHHTRMLWEQVRGQRIFITGGTGFFGCWLLESFCYVNKALKLDAEAVVLTRDARAFREKLPHIAVVPAVRFIEGDMSDFPFPEGEFRFVVHAATAASANLLVHPSAELFASIVLGTRRVLDFAATHGARNFLLTSSGAVYGNQPDTLSHVPETYAGAPNPLDPCSMYGEVKRASEQLCALYRDQADLKCKIARCWSFYGAHLPLDAHYAMGNFIGNALAGVDIEIKGDGTARRSYLYAADLTIWLWTLLFTAPALVPVNVGSGENLSIFELAHMVIKSLGVTSDIHVAKKPDPGATPLRYVPSVERAAEMLGLYPRITMEDGIRRMAAWYGSSEVLKK